MKKHNLKENKKIITEWDYSEQDELYIGYFTIGEFEKCRYKTKRISRVFCFNKKWFPVYVKKWEWISGHNPKWFPHYLPKRYKLEMNNG